MFWKHYKHIHTLLLFLLIGGIVGAVKGQNEFLIKEKPVSFGYQAASARNISAIIIHSTFNNSGGEKYDIDLVIKQFAQYGVSSHYVIGRDGTLYRLVKEKDVAYHAGRSTLPNGASNVNSLSIGIELITSFEEAPTTQQIETLAYLVNDIRSRHKIAYVLRHSDIAPIRKTDPWNVDWEVFLKTIDTATQPATLN